MIVDVVLILVIAAYLFLTGAVLYGAGTSLANAVRRRRLTLAVEDQTADEQPIIVGDYGRMAALPEDLFDHLDRRRRWPAAPNDTWQPARPGDTPGALVPGEGDADPKPTLGQERLYDAEGLVQYGLELVDRRCLDARRDFATDRICPACAKVFGTVTA